MNKFNEDIQLAKIKEYIDSTYSAHYTTGSEDSLQALDLFQARGTLESFALDNALKYLWRFGKKAEKNDVDLYKAVHYISIALGEIERPRPTLKISE